MINWLLKKTRDPIVQIDKDAYEKLQESGISIVYHGDINGAENAALLNQMAIADDYNSTSSVYISLLLWN